MPVPQSLRAATGRGTYVLILSLGKRIRLPIGRLGTPELPPGFYAYVGSAFGPGGLQARLTRHASGARRLHWHIDHLRREARPLEAWFSAGGTHREHAWAAMIASVAGMRAACPGFGSSDCRCDTHLFYSVSTPRMADLGAPLRQRFPLDMPLRCAKLEPLPAARTGRPHT